MKQKLANFFDGAATFFHLTPPLWFAGFCALGAAAVAPALGLGLGAVALAASLGALSGTFHVLNLLIEAGKNKPTLPMRVFAAPATAVTSLLVRGLEKGSARLSASFNKAAGQQAPAASAVPPPQNGATKPATPL